MILLRLLVLFSLASLGCPLAAEVRVDVPPIVLGFAPIIKVSGLQPRAKARLHAFRMFSRWETDDPAKRTGWKQVPVWLHAWADVQADSRGEVDIARTPVRSGTYRGRDPYGLLWSGRKAGDPLLESAPVAGFDPHFLRDGEGRVVVTVGEKILGQASLRSASPPDLRSAQIGAGVLNGAYAAPADGRRHPAVILLHGSEGGDKEGALTLGRPARWRRPTMKSWSAPGVGGSLSWSSIRRRAMEFAETAPIRRACGRTVRAIRVSQTLTPTVTLRVMPGEGSCASCTESWM